MSKTFLICRCKSCNNVTFMGCYETPDEITSCDKEKIQLINDGRNPVVEVFEDNAVMPVFCTCKRLVNSEKERCACVTYCTDDSRVCNGLVEGCDEYKSRQHRNLQNHALSSVEALLGEHAQLLEQNSYCYFELAYTSRTGWMAFICDKPAGGTIGTPEFGVGRKIITQGSGDTPNAACANALLALKADQ